MNISKEVWKEVLSVLEKHKISYTTHYKSRDVQKAMEYPEVTVQDKHVQINLVIPDYFEEDLYYCPTCFKVLELTEIDSYMDTPNEIVDFCLKCNSEVIQLNNKTAK